MSCVANTKDWYYHIGGRTGFAVVQAKQQNLYQQFGVGMLHHICWRVRTRDDVDSVYRKLIQDNFISECGGKIVHAPEIGHWAPGYYSLLFEDRDGIRLEVNHIPGKGLLELQEPQVLAKL
eukprot:TRINITY_DN6483_c0_g1_i2.p1 TRINITY_DN6483_c0_g1~~TRINITY_DN6483_c0_g1_i2.p1  ORF type:complete len:121 (-),score=17.43 TRINITY_DN6483_c0_g1_i2:142-504(-)